MRGIPPTVINGLGTPLSALPRREPYPAARITVWVTDQRIMPSILLQSPYAHSGPRQFPRLRCDGQLPFVRVTFAGLVPTSDPVRGSAAPGADTTASSDRFELDTLDILKRLSRRPIDPGPASELLADLGF